MIRDEILLFKNPVPKWRTQASNDFRQFFSSHRATNYGHFKMLPCKTKPMKKYAPIKKVLLYDRVKVLTFK